MECNVRMHGGCLKIIISPIPTRTKAKYFWFWITPWTILHRNNLLSGFNNSQYVGVKEHKEEEDKESAFPLIFPQMCYILECGYRAWLLQSLFNLVFRCIDLWWCCFCCTNTALSLCLCSANLIPTETLWDERWNSSFLLQVLLCVYWKALLESSKSGMDAEFAKITSNLTISLRFIRYLDVERGFFVCFSNCWTLNFGQWTVTCYAFGFQGICGSPLA